MGDGGRFECLFKTMGDDLKYAHIDGTFVSGRQKATGATGDTSLGHRARAWRGIALVDGLGNLVRFLQLLGQAHDGKSGATPIRGVLGG